MFSTLTSDLPLGLHFIMRWLHVFFAVVWIGHLYYLNFVQGAFMNETDAPTKSQVQQKLLPRVMLWFRMGALWTFITGAIMLMIRGHQDAAAAGMAVFNSPYWINILSGATMATIMFLNVWMVIWPRQKRIIENAQKVAGGAAPDPAAAAGAPRALVASRTNTLLSIPMIFLMLSASHLGYQVNEGSHVGLYWLIFLVLVGAIEVNALVGQTGPITTVKGVIHWGFILTVIVIALNSVLI